MSSCRTGILPMAANDAEGLARLYQARFAPSEIAAKDRVWTILCKDFFSRYVKPTDRVLDVAAGRCEFINHVECAEKYAYDANPDTARFAAYEVGLVVGDCRDMSALPAASFDVVFVSNFFEHLASKQEIDVVLQQIFQRFVLADGCWCFSLTFATCARATGISTIT